jgi:CBS domain-containing protein
MKKDSSGKKKENFDQEIQEDLNRSESEGYAVMYQSQKDEEKQVAKEKSDEKKGERYMKVKDIMTPDPACCTPDTNLGDVAKLMLECDCGEIPVVNNEVELKPLGVITDRDIVCRAIAQDKNPLEMTAEECMSKPCVTVTPEVSIEECCQILEENQIRRIPVVDNEGYCCGVIAQADIARHNLREKVAEIVLEVSQPRKF